MPSHRLQRMAEGRSEGDLLRRIISWADAGLVDADQNTVVHALERIKQYAGTLLGQVEQGIHVNPNPPLVIYGNPPLRGMRRTRMSGERIGVDLLGQLSVDVHEIWYTHVKDGKDYHHPFDEGSATMWAATHGKARVLYLEGPKPLWGDFKR